MRDGASEYHLFFLLQSTLLTTNSPGIVGGGREEAGYANGGLRDTEETGKSGEEERKRKCCER